MMNNKTEIMPRNRTKSYNVSHYQLNQLFLPLATIDDVFTGREKLSLDAASLRVLATEVASGVVAFSTWLNINSASTFTDPEL